MNLRAFPLALLLLLLPMQCFAASASSSSAPADGGTLCRSSFNAALNRERFLFESILVGVQKASDERTGATRVDNKGFTWIKTENDRWVSPAVSEDAISDDDMDNRTAFDALPAVEGSSSSRSAIHPGLLEAQRALTSDIIPPILQGYRGFQCRVQSVCEAVAMAIRSGMGSSASPASSVTVRLPGCREIELKEFSTCRPSAIMSFTDFATLADECQSLATELVRYQGSQLLFLAHQDAAHRTLRQFAGYLEPFLNSVRFPFLTPIRQVSNFFLQWTASPCFLPFCAQKDQ